MVVATISNSRKLLQQVGNTIFPEPPVGNNQSRIERSEEISHLLGASQGLLGIRNAASADDVHGQIALDSDHHPPIESSPVSRAHRKRITRRPSSVPAEPRAETCLDHGFGQELTALGVA